MKRRFIKKLICGTAITTALVTSMPIGVSAASWMSDNMGNYYFYESNSYAVGWRNIDGNVYYFNSSGVMQRGWIQYGDSWYYLDNNGELKTGWISYNNNWYYSDSAGIMQTGIIEVNGQTYYLGDNGIMQKGHAIINGQFYTIGSNGVMIGSQIPVPNKRFDSANNCIQQINSIDTSSIQSPIGTQYDKVIEDESEIGDYEEPARKFTVTFRDSNGEEIKKKTVIDGNSVKMFEPDEEDDRSFVEWNTKRDGSGKSYDDDDKVKVNDDLTLYAVWEEIEEKTEVSSITISGENQVEVGKSIQLTAEVKPSDASNTKVKWSIVSTTSTDGSAVGKATIDQDGVLTGAVDGLGKITVKAEAADGSGISSTKEITVVEAKTLITKIEISTADNASSITADGGQLQLTAKVYPETLINPQIKWKIVSGSEFANISEGGLLKAVGNGVVKVEAVALDGSGVSSEVKEITISGQSVKAAKITVSGYENANKASVGVEFQVMAKIYPDNIAAENNEIEWKAVYVDDNYTSEDLIKSGKLSSTTSDTQENNIQYAILKPDKKGKIEITATSKKDNSIVGKTTITAVQDVDSITIESKDLDGKDKSEIDTNGGKLSLKAILGPEITDTTSVKWTMQDSPDTADSAATTTSSEFATLTTSSKSAVLTAKKNGTVRITATANDNTAIYKNIDVVISNQNIAASDIVLYNVTTGAQVQVSNGQSFDINKGDSVKVKAEINSESTTKDVKWSVYGDKDYITSSINGNEITINADKTLKKETSLVTIKVIADNVVREFNINIHEKVNNIEYSYSGTTNYNVIKGQKFNISASLYPEYISGSHVEWEIQNSVDSTMGQAVAIGTTTVKNNVSTQEFKGIESGKVQMKANLSRINSTISPELTKVINVLPEIETIDVSSSENTLVLETGVSKEAQLTPKVNEQTLINYGSFLHWEVVETPLNITATIDDNGKLSVSRTGDIATDAHIKVKVSATYDSSKYKEYSIGVANAPVVDSSINN